MAASAHDLLGLRSQVPQDIAVRAGKAHRHLGGDADDVAEAQHHGVRAGKVPGKELFDLRRERADGLHAVRFHDQLAVVRRRAVDIVAEQEAQAARAHELGHVPDAREPADESGYLPHVACGLVDMAGGIAPVIDVEFRPGGIGKE